MTTNVQRNFRMMRNLRLSQVPGRIWFDLLIAMDTRVGWSHAKSRAAAGEGNIGLPVEFMSVDQRIALLRKSDNTRRGTTGLQVCGSPVGFSGALDHLPTLTQFHHHYWDWAWELTELPHEQLQEKYRELLTDWLCRYRRPRGLAWHPYVVSNRAWAWVTQARSLLAGTSMQIEVESMWNLHRVWLRRHLEVYLGGNHYIKNLKALLGLGVATGHAADIKHAVEGLRRELENQVLADGVHFERSPAYHALVLSDLVDVGLLLEASGQAHSLPEIQDAITRMRSALSVLVTPDGGLPLFNDGFPAPPGLLAALDVGPAVTCSRYLSESGLARLVAGPWTVFVDAGDPCPHGLPGHAHADSLSVWIYHNDRLVVGEACTSTYEAGDRRTYERSTAAHSTAVIDGQDSTELWGAFRVGRLARVSVVACEIEASSPQRIEGFHDGYRHLRGSPVHRREVLVTDSEVRIRDRFENATQAQSAVVYWHFGPQEVSLDRDGQARLPGGIKVSVQSAIPPFAIRKEGAKACGVLAPDHVIAVPLDLARQDFVETVFSSFS